MQSIRRGSHGILGLQGLRVMEFSCARGNRKFHLRKFPSLFRLSYYPSSSYSARGEFYYHLKLNFDWESVRFP